MEISEFERRVGDGEACESLPTPLQALYWDARGKWDHAHQLVQDGNDEASSWVHAYLHRKEGDLGNAHYWYRRCHRELPQITLEEEWRKIAQELLSRHHTNAQAIQQQQ